MSGFYSLHQRTAFLSILYNGISLSTEVSSINFTGAGQTTSALGNNITVNIPGGAGFTFVVGEVPSGAVDDVNVTYTLAHTPSAGTLALYYAERLINVTDYTLSGTTITMTSPLSPGSTLQGDYEY